MSSQAPTPRAVPTRNPGWLVISMTSRLAVGGYFAYAAAMKVKDSPEVFAKAVRQFELLPPEWSNAVGIMLPWVEMIAALCLITGLFLIEARTIVGAMLLAFVAATIRAILLGLDIRECGCAGAGSKTTPAEIIVRNIVFLGLLALDWYALRRSRGAPRLTPPTHAPDAAPA